MEKGRANREKRRETDRQSEAEKWRERERHRKRERGGSRALPTETNVENGTSQSKSGTSVNLSKSGGHGEHPGVALCSRHLRKLGKSKEDEEEE
jgi:hypothetical protein